MKNKIIFAYFFVIAYLRNLFVNWYNTRIENKKRQWKAYGTFGSGIVPLGKVNQSEATEKASKLGTIVFCDPEQAAIFYTNKK